jgi:hypothetical protein
MTLSTFFEIYNDTICSGSIELTFVGYALCHNTFQPTLCFNVERKFCLMDQTRNVDVELWKEKVQDLIAQYKYSEEEFYEALCLHIQHRTLDQNFSEIEQQEITSGICQYFETQMTRYLPKGFLKPTAITLELKFEGEESNADLTLWSRIRRLLSKVKSGLSSPFN